ncbi:general odorant-binding protein 57c-like [Drosophila innubila]|uniref:general odorant-binding protein 57c-like n=1 Tax=Drosophila innubila TaxID=198719 RepID=UPI00148CCEED|nr:general odorant-binding protein 57c-like [Drosophila innubila]
MNSTFNSVASAIFFALLFVLVQSYSEDDMAQAVDNCMAANNITQMDYVDFMNSTSLEEDEDNIERKYKCFLHCLAEDLDVVDSSGYIDIELVENHGKLSEKDRAAFVECKKENDHMTDMCEYAFSFLFCLPDNLDLTEFNNESE